MKRTSATDKTPWYVRAFHADYLARYKHRSDALARTELPFVIKALNLPARAAVLDLCCGAGRHARALAAALPRGRVIALDLSLDLLRAAQARNSARKKLRFIRADMRRIALAANSMDGVMNLFTSFGYFKTDREHLSVLKEVARVLKPGGRLVLDFFNRTRVLAALVPRSERKHNGQTIVEERRYNARSKRIVKTIRFSNREVLKESVRAYSATELKRLLIHAGLIPLNVYGDLNGAPYNAKTSARCVWVSEAAE